jgi:hypothetical protein
MRIMGLTIVPRRDTPEQQAKSPGHRRTKPFFCMTDKIDYFRLADDRLGRLFAPHCWHT